MKPIAKTLTNALAAIGLAGAAVTPTFAAEVAPTAIEISFADLDLSTAKGQNVLHQRVERAVRVACRATDRTTGTRIISREVKACLAKARSEARVKVSALIEDQQRGG